MAQLRTIWHVLSHQHTLKCEASLPTAFLFNPKVPDSLMVLISSPWATRNLFHFGHLVQWASGHIWPTPPGGLWVLADLPLHWDHHSYLTIIPVSLWKKDLGGPFTKSFNFRYLPDIECLPHRRSRKTFLHVCWERGEISLEAWQVVWSQKAKTYLCTLYKENAHKILYLWYLTPDILHTIYPTSSDHCWSFWQDKGTLFYI